MYPPPEYPDFYVAVLTIVPIVLAGQFVLMRVLVQPLPTEPPGLLRFARWFIKFR